MLDLILKLIDRCIELAKRREETSKARYAQLVAPIFDSFEVVHTDYLDSFKRYRDLIKGTELPLNLAHPILDEISTDTLFSESIRVKLNELADSESEAWLKGLISAIHDYLECAALEPINPREKFPHILARHPLLRVTCGVRMSLAEALRDGFKNGVSVRKRKSEALKTLNAVLAILQRNYKRVNYEHEKLRRKLMAPK